MAKKKKEFFFWLRGCGGSGWPGRRPQSQTLNKKFFSHSFYSLAPFSSTSQSTKAVTSQLANATPMSPTATAFSCNEATPINPTPCLPSSSQAPVIEVEDEEDDEQQDFEEDHISSNATCKKMPVLMPFNDMRRNFHKMKELKGSKSKADDVFDGPSPSIPATTAANVSGVFDKSPLWVRNSLPLSSSNMSQPIIVPTSAGIPLSSPLGRQTVLIQSTPSTTSTVGLTSASQNLGMHTPLLYQLAGPSGVTTPLLGPVLTVFSPPSGLAATPSMFLTNPLQAPNLDIQSLISKTFPATNPQIRTEKRSDSITSEDMSLEKKVMAEPTTGQTFSQDNLMSPMSGVPQPRTLASIPHSELTPEQIELKAFAEDFKTRRIRLGLTQGAVGQSLADKGYSNFAQSTISRFEQMQLSPSNAATIRIILEKWLIEAESPETALANSGNTLPMMAGRKRKKRAVFSSQTKSTLDEYFSQNPKPNRQVIEEISQKLDILPEEVRVWFCNKRQKSKSGTPLSDGPVAFEQDSSISTTSSGAPSPASSYEGGMAQKRRSPSPPKTPFTIEELSKSSNISSPIQFSSSSLSPMGLVASVTQSRDHPMLFGTSHTNCSPPLVSNPLISQLLSLQQVAQTRA